MERLLGTVCQEADGTETSSDVDTISGIPLISHTSPDPIGNCHRSNQYKTERVEEGHTNKI